MIKQRHRNTARKENSTQKNSWQEFNPAPKKVWHPENNLKIIPLGGCEEVGRNMTCFEYGSDIVLLDEGCSRY